MQKINFCVIIVIFLTLGHLAIGQKYIGIYAKNDTKNFLLVDYVIQGQIIQSGSTPGNLSVPVYSLFLSPGSSEEVGVGRYYFDSSKTNPLILNTSSDSTSSYVVLRNLSKVRDSVTITQLIGETGSTSSTQVVSINAGETIKVYLVNVKYVFYSPLISRNSEDYHGITLIVH